MTAHLAALVGSDEAERDGLASALASVGWRVAVVDAREDPAAQLTSLGPDVILVGPKGARAAAWEQAIFVSARRLRVPTVVFGTDPDALSRLGAEDGVIGLLLCPCTAEGASVVVGASIARHRRDARAKDQLETSLALLDAIVHESPLTIYAKDPQMHFLLSNRRHRELIGRPAEDILGRSDIDLFGREGAVMDATGRKVFQTGRADSSEFELELRGQPHVFQEVIFPITLHGRRVGIAGIATDLTEVRCQQALLSERVEELDAIRRISALTSECVELVQRCVSIEESLQLTSRFLARMYPDANLAVYEHLDATTGLTLRTYERRFGEFRPAETLEVQECWAMRTMRAYTVHLGASHIPCRRLACRHLSPSGETCACAPLLSMDRVVGLVSIEMPHASSGSIADVDRVARWSAQFETTIQSLAGALSTVSMRESLHRSALVDGLTKLPNQRAFVTAIEQGLARARRADEVAVVAVVVMSRPQLITSSWGHEESEKLLVRVAELGRTFFRAEDTVARLGAAEFGVVMTMKRANDAEPRLAAFCDELNRRCRSARSPVSTSVGFCVAEPGPPCAPEQLSRLAEQALRDARSDVRRRTPHDLDSPLVPTFTPDSSR